MFARAISLLRVPSVAVLVMALVLAGCATQVHRQVDTLRRPAGDARIVLMPLDVELSELTAGGLNDPRADWTSAAKTHLTTAFETQSDAMGLALSHFDDSALDPETADHLDQIQKLHAAVGGQILRHHYFPGNELPSKDGRFDWTLGPDVRVMKEATGADYALFTYVRDSYATAGRVALIILAAIFRVGVSGGQQVGFASLVDLDSGEIVWFNRLARSSGDLRELEPAQETAETLLAGFPQ